MVDCIKMINIISNLQVRNIYLIWALIIDEQQNQNDLYLLDLKVLFYLYDYIKFLFPKQT